MNSFYCYVRQAGEQFGDALPYNLTNYTPKIFIYDSDGKIVTRGNMVISNLNLGELRYDWQQFDIQEIGIYTFEIQLTNINDNSIITLGSKKDKFEIIVT